MDTFQQEFRSEQLGKEKERQFTSIAEERVKRRKD